MPPVKDDLIREITCLDIISEKSPSKGTALVDVRACNKPAAKVSAIPIKILKYTTISKYKSTV